MKRVLVLVEGQTEERFVKDVLAPFFEPSELFLTPTVLVAKRVKDGPNFKGGVTHFARFESDLSKLLKDSDAFVTTMLDYYALPEDFPGMATRRRAALPEERARHVEMSIDAHFKRPPNLRTFLALHEFEAWLFADTKVLPEVMATRPQEAALPPYALASKRPSTSMTDLNRHRQSASKPSFLRIGSVFTDPMLRCGLALNEFEANVRIFLTGWEIWKLLERKTRRSDRSQT